MAYTPNTTFTFSPGSYTPGTTFNFSADETVTGDLSAPLAGVSGTLIAISAAPGDAFGLLSATLQGVSGDIVRKGVLNATLDGVTGEFECYSAANIGRFDVTLQGVGGYLFAHYDSNVPRHIVNQSHSVQQDAKSHCLKSALVQQQTTALQDKLHAPRDKATAHHHPVRLPYGHTSKTNIKRCGTVADATPLGHQATAAFDLLDWYTLQRCIMFDQASSLHHLATAVAEQMTKVYPDRWTMAAQDMAQTITDFTYTVYGDPANPYTPTNVFSFAVDPTYTPNQPFEFLDAPTPIVWSMRHVRGIDGLSFISPRQQAGPRKTKTCIPVEQARRPPPGTSDLIEPERPPYEPPPDHVTLTIPTQTVYSMQHIISVKTVPGNLDVPVGSVNLSYDADSFAWQFSGTLIDAAALDTVSTVGGEPVTLAVTIDSITWHVLVESIEHGIQFAKNTISLKGRSLTAKLGVPYVLPTSATQGSELTVQQLAESVLPVDWSIVWNAPTWIVPAGAWSYTNQTPIQVLSNLVNDIGCVAVPHNTLQQITIQPRYPVYSWYFSTAPADLAIPEAALKSVNLRPAIATQANGVYVHGGDIGGVLGWCRLTGTDGARLAATVSNALMTDVIGCRLLGERILSGQWQQPIVKSITLPLDNDVFPLAQVGQLVAITLSGEIIKGIVNSVSIDANLNSVSQSLQIGEETANVWTLFNTLLPRDPLLVGTVTSTDGTLSVITLLDAGVVSVRGTATVGTKVYIRAGRIEGPAPSMVQNEIVV